MKADLCFGFSTEKWRELAERLGHDESAWAEAIDVFERRMKERFFSCIEVLEKADTRPYLTNASEAHGAHCVPGFSIMALCCLLIETLQGFQESGASAAQLGHCAYPAGPCVKPLPDTTGQFIKFLRRPAFGPAFAEDGIAKSFVRGIRNGILHEAETRKWVIWSEGPRTLVAPVEDGYALNRKMFFEAVKQEFQSYIENLRDPAKGELRNRFKKKMNDICKES